MINLSSPQMFGLVKGSRIGVAVDTSDANCGFGRLTSFQEALGVRIYFLRFSIPLHSLHSGLFFFVLFFFVRVTVNQLNFAAVKFRCLPIQTVFRAIKFPVFWPTLLHKSGLNSLNNGPIFKILSVSETRDRATQYFVC